MNAQQLKNAILQEAIEGRLVPQDPNDEPASALLARIRKEKERLVKEGKLKKKDLEVKPISEDEIPFEIPESWEWCRVSDISESYIGLTYKPSDVSDRGWVVLRSSNIQDGNLDFSDIVRVNIDVPVKLHVHENDIIICARNGSKKLVGKSALVKEITEPMTFGAFMAMCRTPFYSYMSMYLLSPLFFDQLRKDSDTTTINQLTQKNFNKYIVPLPPLAEQKRIVAKIEELLPKIEKYGKAQDELNKLNEELPERLKKSILQEAIEGRLVPQDPNDEPASVLLQKIREEKQQLVKAGKLKKKDLIETPISEDEIPFAIPDTWEWVRLGEISTYANTKKKINAANADPHLWGLDLEDIEKGGRLLSFKTVGERKAIGDKTCFSEGDILYSKLRPYLLKILVAPKDGICTPEIIPFTCYGNICKTYIVNLLKSAYVDDYINSVTFGVKMPRVSTETMISLVLPLPPLAEQKRIVAKIEQLLGEIDKLKKK